MQQHQQRAAHTDEHDRQHQRSNPGQCQHPGGGAAHTFFVPGTKRAADRQGQAVVHAKSKVHDQAIQRGGRADLGQGGIAQDMPGQGGIGQVIKLL